MRTKGYYVLLVLFLICAALAAVYIAKYLGTARRMAEVQVVLGEVEQSHRRLQESQQDLEARLLEMQGALEEAKKEAAEVGVRTEVEPEALRSLKADREELLDRVASLEAEMKRLAEDELGMLQEQQGLVERLLGPEDGWPTEAEVQAQLTSLRQELEQERVRAQAATPALPEESERPSAREVELGREVQALEEARTQLLERAASLETQVATLREEQKRLLQEREGLLEKLVAPEGALPTREELEAQLAALRAELEREEAPPPETRGPAEKTEAEPVREDVLAGDLERLQKERRALQERVASLETQVTELEEERRALQITQEELLSRLVGPQEGRPEQEELQAALSAVRAEVESLQRRFGEELRARTRELEEVHRVEREELEKTYQKMLAELKEEIEGKEATVERQEGGLRVSLVDRVLFGSGSHYINERGQDILSRVVPLLLEHRSQEIRIEGHTDDVPVSRELTRQFPTNWELSTARATSVVRYLEDRGISSDKLSAAGFSYYRPVASNETEEGRQLNRRIEILLMPQSANSAAP